LVYFDPCFCCFLDRFAEIVVAIVVATERCAWVAVTENLR